MLWQTNLEMVSNPCKHFNQIRLYHQNIKELEVVHQQVNFSKFKKIKINQDILVSSVHNWLHYFEIATKIVM